MKKTLALILSLVLVLALCCVPAFAEDSKTYSTEVEGVVDEEGNEVEVMVGETSVAVITEEMAADLTSGKVDAKEISVVWQQDIETTATGPVTMTFYVDGSDGQMLYVFHNNNGTWELAGSGVGPSVTVTFEHLSPVAIAVQTPAGGDDPISPPTGVAGGILAACAVLTAAGASAFAVAKKKD